MFVGIVHGMTRYAFVNFGLNLLFYVHQPAICSWSVLTAKIKYTSSISFSFLSTFAVIAPAKTTAMASKYLIFAFFSILITLTAAFTCTDCAALELRPPSTGMPWDKDGSSSQHVATPSKRDDAQLIQPDGPHQTAKLGYKTELTKECAQACLKTCRPFDFLPYEYADCREWPFPLCETTPSSGRNDD